jgi:hypothetical protein
MTHDRKDDMLLENHIKEEMERYEIIERRLAGLEDKMSELLDVWTQAKGAMSFVKIMAGLAATAAAIYAYLHDHFSLIAK